MMLGMVIFWILLGLTLTLGSIAPNCDLCLGALYKLCPQVSVPSSLYSAVDQWQQPKCSFLFWTEMREVWGLEKKNLKTARNYADFKKASRQEIFSTNENLTRALLTHDCLISDTVFHRIDCNLQSVSRLRFWIHSLNKSLSRKMT